MALATGRLEMRNSPSKGRSSSRIKKNALPMAREQIRNAAYTVGFLGAFIPKLTKIATIQHEGRENREHPGP
jgi:hypothetical protein